MQILGLNSSVFCSSTTLSYVVEQLAHLSQLLLTCGYFLIAVLGPQPSAGAAGFSARQPFVSLSCSISNHVHF